MGSQEKKMDQGSKKGRAGERRMGMLGWKEDRSIGLHGVVDAHFDQM